MDKKTINISQEDNLKTDILSLLFANGYQESDTLSKLEQIIDDDTETLETSKKLLSGVRTISAEEVNKVLNPITMKVVYVEENNNLTLKRGDGGDNWTNVYNPTIYTYLEPGDEVVVGFQNGQASNCYVLFAKVKGSDYKKKTILRNIHEANEVNKQTQILKKWVVDMIEKMYPDIPIIEIVNDVETVVGYRQHPKKIAFYEDMKQWKDVNFERM